MGTGRVLELWPGACSLVWPIAQLGGGGRKHRVCAAEPILLRWSDGGAIEKFSDSPSRRSRVLNEIESAPTSFWTRFGRGPIPELAPLKRNFSSASPVQHRFDLESFDVLATGYARSDRRQIPDPAGGTKR